MKTILTITAILMSMTIAFTQNKNIKTDEKYLIDIKDAPLKSNTPLTFIATPNQADMKFDPTVKSLASKNHAKEANELYKYKQEIYPMKGRIPTNDYNVFKDESDERGVSFNLGKSFYGDIDGGCPNDNTISVSNGGKIISMMNGAVGIYNTNGSKLNTYGLGSFFNNLIGDPCDPKVEYDRVSDRFFMFVQACGDYKDKIAFGFSQTNDPNGNWYIYVFSSDPFSDGSWSDYPKIGFTKDEVFVSLNLFGATDGNYRQSVVYQLDKKAGYKGENLTNLLWRDFKEGTMLVIRSGVNQYGPGVYLVNTHFQSASEFTLYDITNNINGNPQLKTYKIPTTYYEVPAAADQAGSSQKLDTGDGRAQDGFYQNGIIHFVHSVSDKGYGAVRYYRINTSDMNGNNFFTTSDAGNKDYVYPSLSPFTNSPTDQTAILHFGASGVNYYSEMRAKVFNHDFTTEASGLIKAADAPTTDCYDSGRGVSRWGDYTGIALQYNGSVPTVWVAGSISSTFTGIWWTYIAELKAQGVSTSTSDEDIMREWKAYPNPTQNRINLEFNIEKRGEVNFTLYNYTGQVVSELYRDVVKNGDNRFSFDVSSLDDGIYLLTVKNSNNEIIKNEKIIVAK